MIGLMIAFVGILGAQLFDMPVLDGVASVGIGIVLALVAILLAIESKGLLIGEGADRDKRIWRTNEILTMHLGPDDILLNASFDFIEGLTANDVENAISQFERRIKKAYPSIRRVFIEAQGWGDHSADASRKPQV